MWSLIVGIAGLFLTAAVTVSAQEHIHTPEHIEFYSKWYVPNNGNPRRYSCCNNEDCFPTPIQYEGGKYWAKRQDGSWAEIPADRLEQNQEDVKESPDGQSHACIQKTTGAVICATLGAGI